jgi:hypothetical protein
MYDSDDTHFAILSGDSFNPDYPSHYLLLDYDKNYVPEEWNLIVKEYKLRRAQVWESSKGRYWLTSFSLIPAGQVLEIMYWSKCDKNQAQFMFKDGFVGLRLSKKKDPEYPKLIDTIDNEDVKDDKEAKFYNYDVEKIFTEYVKGKMDNEKKEIFEKLIKLEKQKRRDEDEKNTA